jgi:hypothetical protein
VIDDTIKIEIDGAAIEFPRDRAVKIARALNAAVARQERTRREAEGLDQPPKDLA